MENRQRTDPWGRFEAGGLPVMCRYGRGYDRQQGGDRHAPPGLQPARDALGPQHLQVGFPLQIGSGSKAANHPGCMRIPFNRGGVYPALKVTMVPGGGNCRDDGRDPARTGSPPSACPCWGGMSTVKVKKIATKQDVILYGSLCLCEFILFFLLFVLEMDINI